MTVKLFLLIKLTHQILLKENSGELRLRPSTLWFECGGMSSNVISLDALSLHISIITLFIILSYYFTCHVLCHKIRLRHMKNKGLQLLHASLQNSEASGV